jgi:hypothetical protein
VKLPTRKRGYQSEAEKERYAAALAAFCRTIIGIKSTLGFAATARGYSYYLEGRHIVTKGEFAAAEKLIGECRKNGALPYNVCAIDETRVSSEVERIDYSDIDDEAERALDNLRGWHQDYTPASFWDQQDVYIELAVEKADLRNLFAPICARFRIRMTNLKGWCDINERVEMMKRFAEKAAEGKRCILLVCGDHDPGGLHITDFLHGNLSDTADAVEEDGTPALPSWHPDELEIVRFGLNRDFIDAQGLMWIDNLETSSGKDLSDPRHHDHRKDYVQDYLREHSARKVEANALMAVPAAGRQVCLDAITRYITESAVEEYENRVAEQRANLAERIAELMGDDRD